MRYLPALLLIVGCSAAFAQTYRWMDPATGRTVVSDTPPPGNAKGVSRMGGLSEVTDNSSYALKIASEKFPVTLYTSPDCMEECSQARDHLNKRGIPFTETMVQSSAQFTELRELVGESVVPTLKVGKQPVRGFNPASYNNVLDIAGYPKASPPRGTKPSGAPTQ